MVQPAGGVHTGDGTTAASGRATGLLEMGAGLLLLTGLAGAAVRRARAR